VQLVEQSAGRIGRTVRRRRFQKRHAIIVGAVACRLIRVVGIGAAEITRGEAALDDEGTGAENRSMRRHGELSGEGGVARSAKRKKPHRGLV